MSFMAKPHFVPLIFQELPETEMTARASTFRDLMLRRRTVRSFSSRPVPLQIILDALTVAGSAPSGANLQPWHFSVISDPAIKRKIRTLAEAEEHEFYHHRAPQEWLDALEPLGTDEFKPYLEVAPYLIAVFSQTYGQLPDGRKVKNYYVPESVGIAVGMMIAALHQAGLATLTHTPSPMGFLNEILGRPKNEKAFLLLVVGYPSEGALVPSITKKPLDQIATFF
jgi:iodotyrosine deiodinase